MSHNNSYASSVNLSDAATISGDTSGSLSGVKYHEVFNEGTYSGALSACTMSEGGTGSKCIVNCSCNEANGWKASSAGMTNPITVTSNRTYYNGNSSAAKVTCYKENQSYYVTSCYVGYPEPKNLTAHSYDGCTVDIDILYSDGSEERITKDDCECERQVSGTDIHWECPYEYSIKDAGKNGETISCKGASGFEFTTKESNATYTECYLPFSGMSGNGIRQGFLLGNQVWPGESTGGPQPIYYYDRASARCAKKRVMMTATLDGTTSDDNTYLTCARAAAEAGYTDVEDIWRFCAYNNKCVLDCRGSYSEYCLCHKFGIGTTNAEPIDSFYLEDGIDCDTAINTISADDYKFEKTKGGCADTCFDGDYGYYDDKPDSNYFISLKVDKCYLVVDCRAPYHKVTQECSHDHPNGHSSEIKWHTTTCAIAK